MSDERRLERLAELLKHEIGGIIQREFDFSPTLVTVSAAVLSSGRQQATVYVTVYPLERGGEVLGELQKNVGAVQRELNAELEMRPVPKIRFVLDESEERRRHILDLLDKVK